MNSIAIANRLYARGDYESALREYTKILKEYPALAGSISINIEMTNKKIIKGIHVGYAKNIKRAVVFASYSAKGLIEDYVVWYLERLRDVADTIVFVADCEINTSYATERIGGLVNAVFCGRHGEYDFGSYKRGLNYLKESGGYNEFDEIILCNDSCYGPVNGFVDIFKRQERINLDFWGLTSNSEFGDHLQSFFLVFRKNVIRSSVFKEFFDNVKAESSVSEVILKYEVGLTKKLEGAGFIWGSFVDNQDPYISDLRKINSNLTVFPLSLINHGVQLIKVKALSRSGCNYEGVANTIDFLKRAYPDFLSKISSHVDLSAYFVAKKIKFSIILPTHDRGALVEKSINSVLAQSYDFFELIVVDDGSTDNTEEIVKLKFGSELRSGVIKFIRSENCEGVSAARNKGLKIASGDWIAYLDSDNLLKPNFLSMFYDEIINDKSGVDCFYSAFVTMSDNKPHGRDFDFQELLRENYIDLGVFVHKRSVLSNVEGGGFDENLKRLVDWDFIIRCVSNRLVKYIPFGLMLYNDCVDDLDRISVRESYNKALYYIRSKHSSPYKVSSVILSFNHSQYLRGAIESAAEQKLDIPHEIFVFDDSSTDGSWEIICNMAKRYPGLIKACKHERNLGQAANMLGAIGASRGDFVAILEGDDWWDDAGKLQKQAEFLINNHDCSMVFNKIRVFDDESGEYRFLGRQENIQKTHLTAADFLVEPSMNLIANFSSCMFRRYVLEAIPEFAWRNRFTEIAAAFHFDKFGAIGFINEPLSVYRQHSNGLWSGASKVDQAISAIKVRLDAELLAKACWRDEIRSDIISRLNSIRKDM